MFNNTKGGNQLKIRGSWFYSSNSCLEAQQFLSTGCQQNHLQNVQKRLCFKCSVAFVAEVRLHTR